jgi:hypothetical protein
MLVNERPQSLLVNTVQMRIAVNDSECRWSINIYFVRALGRAAPGRHGPSQDRLAGRFVGFQHAQVRRGLRRSAYHHRSGGAGFRHCALCQQRRLPQAGKAAVMMISIRSPSGITRFHKRPDRTMPRRHPVRPGFVKCGLIRVIGHNDLRLDDASTVQTCIPQVAVNDIQRAESLHANVLGAIWRDCHRPQKSSPARQSIDGHRRFVLDACDVTCGHLRRSWGERRDSCRPVDARELPIPARERHRLQSYGHGFDSSVSCCLA